MMTHLADRAWGDIYVACPGAKRFFSDINVAEPLSGETFEQWLDRHEDSFFDELAMDRDAFQESFERFIDEALRFGLQSSKSIDCLTLLGGTAKNGDEELVRIVARPGEVICIVGPTGSGKSRLLGDIECLAQCDTPTRRKILVDDAEPEYAERFSASRKLVAQLSQNMNFVLDASAGEFITLHARSRQMAEASTIATDVVEKANTLCGEPFLKTTPICALSGGQSRALMIADVALVSPSPIVLIDELENAGVDRKAALELLMDKGKIIFIATHDPLLMLLGSRRIVMRDGAITNVVGRNRLEECALPALEQQDRWIGALRDRLRRGEPIDGLIDGPFANLTAEEIL